VKFCQPHWDMLRAAIKVRGIDHLGAKTGEAAIADIKAELEQTERDYDPLMDCHWMITSRAVKAGGLAVMCSKPDGSQYCPVCEAVAHGAPEESWINGPADAALEICRTKGLVPPLTDAPG
jgi:hypothetical protein